MASDTSSPAAKVPRRLTGFCKALRAELVARCVPLLVLRLPQLERIAWHKGKTAARRVEQRAARAFSSCAPRCLRDEDLLGHDCGSDVFVAAIGQPRGAAGSAPRAIDCRTALERLAAGMTAATELRVQTGWTLLQKLEADALIGREITLALERGARERERYEFFATVGHELRTPLTSIRGYIETLLDEKLDADTTKRFLQTALRETRRVGRLVENMFEFSLLDFARELPARESCELEAALAAACDAVLPLATRRGVRISYNAPPHVLLEIDFDSAVQALVNLLNNAVAYGRLGGCVCVASSMQASHVRITVDDDGPGVAPVDRENIFGFGVRAPDASRPGTGIGLAIVRMVAQRAGGDVYVTESRLGGAQFVLLLPALAELASAAS